jgi:protein-disulfide isomerase
MKFNKGAVLVSILIIIFSVFYIINFIKKEDQILVQENKKITEKNQSIQNDKEEKNKLNLDSNKNQQDDQQKTEDSQDNKIQESNVKTDKTDEKSKINYVELKNKILSIHLDDLWMGNKDSELIIFEYTSITCPHCKKFHEQVFPKIKSEFIDKQKILYIPRDFPTDTISFRSSLLFSEIKNRFEVSKLVKLREMLIKNQDQVAKAVYEHKSNPKEAFNSAINVLKDIFKVSISLSESEFDKLTDLDDADVKKKAEEIISKIDELSKFLGEETGAPTFIVFNKKNDKFKKIEGVKQFDEWEYIISSEMQ